MSAVLWLKTLCRSKKDRPQPTNLPDHPIVKSISRPKFGLKSVPDDPQKSIENPFGRTTKMSAWTTWSSWAMKPGSTTYLLNRSIETEIWAFAVTGNTMIIAATRAVSVFTNSSLGECFIIITDTFWEAKTLQKVSAIYIKILPKLYTRNTYLSSINWAINFTSY